MNTNPSDYGSTLASGQPMASSAAVQLPPGMQQIPGTPYFVFGASPAQAPVYIPHDPSQFATLPIATAAPAPVYLTEEITEEVVFTYEDHVAFEQGLKKARLTMIGASASLTAFLVAACVLDFLNTWPRVKTLRHSGFLMAAALFTAFFFLCNIFQLAYAIKGSEKWRSKIAVPALILMVGSFLAALAHFWSTSNGQTAIGAILLVCSMVEVVYYRGFLWQEKIAKQTGDHHAV